MRRQHVYLPTYYRRIATGFALVLPVMVVLVLRKIHQMNYTDENGVMYEPLIQTSSTRSKELGDAGGIAITLMRPGGGHRRLGNILRHGLRPFFSSLAYVGMQMNDFDIGGVSLNHLVDREEEEEGRKIDKEMTIKDEEEEQGRELDYRRYRGRGLGEGRVALHNLADAQYIGVIALGTPPQVSKVSKG